MRKNNKSNKLNLKQHFRTQIQKNVNVIELLDYSRKNIPSGEYKSCVEAFKLTGGHQASQLFNLGIKSIEDLVWKNNPLQPLSLAQELLWAENWLANSGSKISLFIKFKNRLQELILQSKFELALESLENFVEANGWSLWAVEIKCMLESEIGGVKGLDNWLSPIFLSAKNSFIGLLLEIFNDRCNENISFLAFYSKFKNSFSKLNFPLWATVYLEYRAIGQVDNLETNLPFIFSREITSCLIDYYEIVVFALSAISSENELSKYKNLAGSICSKLLNSNIQDSRLDKINKILKLDTEISIFELNENERILKTLYYKKVEPIIEKDSLEEKIIIAFEECVRNGSASSIVLENLIKLAVNYKNFEFGDALISTLFTIMDNRLRFSPTQNVMLFSKKFVIEDVTLYPFDKAKEILLHQANLNNKLAINILDILDSSTDELKEEPNILHLWAAKKLLEEEKYEDLERILLLLDSFGGFWKRQAAKIKFLSMLRIDKLNDAMDLLIDWITINPRYTIEFAVADFFVNKKWKNFKDLDPVKVGLIAHHAYQNTDATGIGYICKMACRSFLLSGSRNKINEIYENTHPDERENLTLFLKDVWVEENLSLCDKFESTDIIRNERMEILQLLLYWDKDKERATSYTVEIKDITFDQTLQRGLRQIDQTRVFVNESAINRWAETNLLQEYERWLKLKESNIGVRVVDEYLRKYSLDSINSDVLKDSIKDGPTVSDVLLMEIIDRLYKRFLNDPTDGLDCYLSLRIRHGSLRGTVFGPLEEERLLYSASDFSRDEFMNKWSKLIDFNLIDLDSILNDLELFSKEVKKLVDDLVIERIQIRSPDKTNGAFSHYFTAESLRMAITLFSESPISFSSFLSNCYFVFWKLVEYGLKVLNNYVLGDFKKKIKKLFDELIEKLRSYNQRQLIPLISTLHQVSTATQSQCDVIADWFRLPAHIGDDEENFKLPDAIDIASAATRNVYRTLSADFNIICTPNVTLPLTTSALAVLTDCLFVIFENAWKHSGLGTGMDIINISTVFEEESKLLTFKVLTPLSAERKSELLDGELDELRRKYIGNLPLDLVSAEGGSGFAKLAKLVRFVPLNYSETPFDFGIEDDQWFVRVTVPLYERSGRFEAYE